MNEQSQNNPAFQFLRTEGGKTKSNAIEIPSISLPKGGGAIRGIGEKFAANPVTGTGSMQVPIITSPGRSGFGPQLSLSYDSGAGNGLFGLGWNLSMPSITRKTDKGLPRYLDDKESDVFILSGVEDLVPVLIQKGDQWVRENLPPRTINGISYLLQRYRPRIEGLFARIERWTNINNAADTFWRSISKDNITTFYGKTPMSRITDATDQTHIFSWLICQSHDDKGNLVVYDYKPENATGIDFSQAHERNRSNELHGPNSRSVNRYLKRILYGNRTPFFPDYSTVPPPGLPADNWMFEVVFDYGEHHADMPQPSDDPAVSNSIGWPRRNDPFSSYRAGFEVRTYRLCQRVLMFHHFPAETGVGANCLVRSTDFTYSYENDPGDPQNPVFSFLNSVSQSGYKRNPDNTYVKKSMPPLEFTYSKPVIHEAVYQLDLLSLENLPAGLDATQYQWVDLDGEGLSGALTEQADGWFYKRNISPLNVISFNGGEHIEALFAPVELVASRPALSISPGHGQLLDLAGDGQLDVVMFNEAAPGFYERTITSQWDSFVPFKSFPVLNWNDPNLRFVDLTGDGHADILISEDDVFTWYPSLAEAGFSSAERVGKVFDEEKGPRLIFGDGTQSIYLADMSGDGLTDLVRIRNGEVCYWPSLGYGRFAAKVTMDNSPWFDLPDQFSQQHIRLADIDGSGATDIIYLGRKSVKVFFNQSGNSWSATRELTQFPPIDNLASVMTADLLGNGMACLVWSSPLPGNSPYPMRYMDLMDGQKPHLLLKSINNLGAETHVYYSPSTKFYLEDKFAGKPWITRIPFPVHVVERVETYDRISRNRFITRYAYHHGYFDGIEREFRGFGMVEQWDTEELAALNISQQFPVGTNIEEASHVPPVLTKTWFHTGIYLGSEHVSDFFAEQEYYREPGLSPEQAKELLLADTIIPPGLTVEEEREACRALRGSMLRQEIYAQDGTSRSQHPYTVTEQNFTLRCLQAKAENRHAVFFCHARETTSYHYERIPADPRINHTLVLEVDDYGNSLKEAAVGYGRRPGISLPLQADKDKQSKIYLTYTENYYTNPIIVADNDYRTPLPGETLNFELSGFPLPAGSRFDFDWLNAAGPGAVPIDYESTPVPGLLQKRLIEHHRILYRPNDMGESLGDPLALLPLGILESMALPGENYNLAFSPGLVNKVFQRNGQSLVPNLTNIFGTGARYRQSQEMKAGGAFPATDLNGDWWIPSGRVFFSPDNISVPELSYARQHFFQPHRFRNPFHTTGVNTETVLTYDTYDLLMLEIRDALDNRVTVGERDNMGNLSLQGNDYRVLQPTLVMDPNRNRTAAVYDALGMLVGTAIMGKPDDIEGDTLNGFDADLSDADILNIFAHPVITAPNLLQRATTRIVYDLFEYHRTRDNPEPRPSMVYALVRETHDADLATGGQSRIRHSFSYSDGFGREIQKKIQAEPGRVPMRNEGGQIIIGLDQQPVLTNHELDTRWVGSGWTVFNNKGKPVRQYEPFFTDTYRFEFDTRIGVSPVIFYDPLERVVATLHPNHSWEKVVFNPWQQSTWDVNDTVLIHDPRSDADVGEFFNRLPETDCLPGWYAIRQGGALGVQEQDAALKAAIHAATPTITHADSLGRSFLSISHNKFRSGNAPASTPVTEEFYSTRVSLDIEGSQREVRDAVVQNGDAQGRIVMQYDYDMLGNLIHQASMEAGERWMLNDVSGKPVYAWDSRGHNFRTSYDNLRRPKDFYLSEGTGAELLTGRIIYGESQVNPGNNNLRGKVYQVYDQAGVVTNNEYDFKGNLLLSQRRLAREYKTTLDWLMPVPFEVETFTSQTSYDALDRSIRLIAPHSDQAGARMNIIQPIYNEANLLNRIDVWLDQTAEPPGLIDAAVVSPSLVGVDNINYNAKGLREMISYRNGVSTSYNYDSQTSRLVQLLTRRDTISFPGDCPQPSPGWPGCQVQNIRYTYDPVGNITNIRDDARQRIFFNNQRIEPGAGYTYDAIYRLIEATGREQLGQTGTQPVPHSYNDIFRIRLPHPNNGNAMGNYCESYVYDEVGNILEMIHRRSCQGLPSWRRRYTYNEPSLIELGKLNNRLTGTTIGTTTETYSSAGNGYDIHGNMLHMPHLQVMQWDFKDQLQMTRRQAVNSANEEGFQSQGERTWYVYDASGQRVRKVTELQNGTVKDERIYLGGFEIYRRNGINPIVRETLHIMDDKQRIALVETRTQGNEPGVPAQLIRYQFGNHLGSSSLELDHQGQIISYEEYTPYGNTSYQAVRNQTETFKRYRYTGKERDEESGLYYHGARYYAPWLTRWTSCDPKGLIDGSNLFAYCRLSPICNHDKTGKAGEPTQDSPLLISGIYRKLPTMHGYIREHLIPGRQLFWMLAQEYGKDDVEKIFPRSYSNMTAVLSPTAISDPKTLVDNAETAKLRNDFYKGVTSYVRDLVLKNKKNLLASTLEGARTTLAQTEIERLEGVAARQMTPFFQTEVLLRELQESGTEIPKVLAQKLNPLPNPPISLGSSFKILSQTLPVGATSIGKGLLGTANQLLNPISPFTDVLKDAVGGGSALLGAKLTLQYTARQLADQAANGIRMASEFTAEVSTRAAPVIEKLGEIIGDKLSMPLILYMSDENGYPIGMKNGRDPNEPI